MNNTCLEFSLENLALKMNPFPYTMKDEFLDHEHALTLQREILDIHGACWDRYDNPFEQKYTLRDKFNMPPLLTKLFHQLTSEDFVRQLSCLVGIPLVLDTTRNFWGVHLYGPGDKLDIHVDAGLHPTLGLKKQVTLGLYLSKDWTEDCGCALEIWRGENSASNDARIFEKVDSIAPMFNRLVLFLNNDYSWHGNPEPATCGPDSRRIFVTLSYLSEVFVDENKRVKAFFVARPQDPLDEEKDKMRLLRADPEKYKEIYRI